MLRSFGALALALAIMALAACGESTGPSDARVTVDTLLAEISDAQNIGSVGVAAGGTAVPFAAMPSAAQCPYDAGSQHFVCATITRDGLTVSLYYQLFDASGAPQSEFDRETTAAIRTVSDMSGTSTSPPGALPQASTTITSHRDHTMSGLLTATRTLNGTGNSTIESTVVLGSEQRTHSFTMLETTTNLVLPERGSQNRYPQSGTIEVEMTSAGGTFDVHITMTFDGTSIATIVMTMGDTTQTCTLDMSAQQPAAVCG